MDFLPASAGVPTTPPLSPAAAPAAAAPGVRRSLCGMPVRCRRNDPGHLHGRDAGGCDGAPTPQVTARSRARSASRCGSRNVFGARTLRGDEALVGHSKVSRRCVMGAQRRSCFDAVCIATLKLCLLERFAPGVCRRCVALSPRCFCPFKRPRHIANVPRRFDQEGRDGPPRWTLRHAASFPRACAKHCQRRDGRACRPRHFRRGTRRTRSSRMMVARRPSDAALPALKQASCADRPALDGAAAGAAPQASRSPGVRTVRRRIVGAAALLSRLARVAGRSGSGGRATAAVSGR